jgi:hypothetical protein
MPLVQPWYTQSESRTNGCTLLLVGSENLLRAASSKKA